MAVSQMGYGYRNLFGWRPRTIEIYPLSDECLPDGTKNCRRMTDCCSNWCTTNGPSETICKPTPCDCPQSPWGPVNDYCKWPLDSCHVNEYCCSGYCHQYSDPSRHGGGRYPVCIMPPCKPCDLTYKK
ncbi:unnamed protein product [Allacma fusca]|uniref:Uncharacterized protein n=1 Tax=Allacma fusca TaxID=39272 RepID=A0A8J2KI81_9HEXA|nr:unnamed protein product [Allacma fusca]